MEYFIIFIINIAFVYFVRSANRYWLLSIPLWIILFSSFFVWRTESDKTIAVLQSSYWQSMGDKGYGDQGKLQAYENAQKRAQNLNMIFIYCIGLQTAITFILQVLGSYLSKLKIYSFTKSVFGIIFLIIFLLITMIGIVPSGGIIA